MSVTIRLDEKCLGILEKVKDWLNQNKSALGLEPETTTSECVRYVLYAWDANSRPMPSAAEPSKKKTRRQN